MKCILDKCAWAKDGYCNTLGECGASYALERARQPGGYEVLARDNRTIDGLVKAGLVMAVPTADRTLIVKATASALRRTERAA